MALFGSQAWVGRQEACRLPSLALSLCGPQFHAHLPLSPFSSMQGRRAMEVSFCLCLAGCSLLTQPQTCWPQMMCACAFPCAIIMSFISSMNNLRRSTRMHDTSYRPHTMWSLPEIISVALPFFFLSFWSSFQKKSQWGSWYHILQSGCCTITLRKHKMPCIWSSRASYGCRWCTVHGQWYVS